MLKWRNQFTTNQRKIVCVCVRVQERECVCLCERERREGKKFWSFCGLAPKALNFLICSTMIIHPFQTSSHWLWHYTYQLITVPHPPFNILFIREVVIEHLTLPQAWALTHTHTRTHAHRHTDTSTHTHAHSHTHTRTQAHKHPHAWAPSGSLRSLFLCICLDLTECFCFSILMPLISSQLRQSNWIVMRALGQTRWVSFGFPLPVNICTLVAGILKRKMIFCD